jgi:hypothetical protein
MRTGEMVNARRSEAMRHASARVTLGYMKSVRTLIPLDQTELEARVQELAAQGLVRLGSREPLPEDFFTRPLPGEGAGVLDQLLRDREEDD